MSGLVCEYPQCSTGGPVERCSNAHGLLVCAAHRRLRIGSYICQACEDRAPTTPAPEVRPPVIPAIACPFGGHVDNIQKVSAICAAGTSAGVVRYGDGQVRTTASTELATVLRAPEARDFSGGMPYVNPEDGDRGGSIGCLAIALIACASLPFYLGATLSYGSPYVLAPVAISVLLLIYAIRGVRSAYQRQEPGPRPQMSFEGLKSEWAAAYYCHRDGIVFTPADGKRWTPAEFENRMLTYWRPHL